MKDGKTSDFVIHLANLIANMFYELNF